MRKITLFILFVLSLASFTIIQTIQNDKELIIGTWIPEGCLECKLVFTTNGKLYDYYQGSIDNTYNYSISESTASNGVTFSYLKTVNINDPKDTNEYDINGLNDTVMYLDYLGDRSTNLLKYTRQQ
ncbi:hypothetical protein [Tenacibaculum sp. 190524A05c]|uniref:hypothetical protein n=1 Tax=Tenacibaculum platacis TaxID=3137852 RepID=UPI0032B21B2A